ncbi:epidermal differentiation-specific protein-like [Latimeria chalumnae]|uniref:epidermal differentiation-specific protein-like n=1 Tax=Latimeria chalumnae TaxID=7897 RepID=UPI0006D90464|nr:PREDICTED: epidermal differentiation-specific protein-like [Latimeria chalumnae]|eukprot:XP_014345238.1 PREDICTED: epidermal differentiation-specific protein-like [Latimeria chalumnae]
MSFIELHEDECFEKKLLTLIEDCKNLGSTACSLIVKGDPWILFTGINFTGTYEIFKEGRYVQSADDNFNSARVVRGGLSCPRIALYPHTSFTGAELELTSEQKNVKHAVSSYKVHRGAWSLYDWDGNEKIALAEDKVPEQSMWVKDIKPFL